MIATFILPLTYDSTRVPVPNEVFKEFNCTLARTFGGYTRTPSAGGWIDESGSLVEDSGWCYRLGLENDAASALRKLLEGACRTFDQRCIYLDFGKVAEFIEPAPAPARLHLALPLQWNGAD